MGKGRWMHHGWSYWLMGQRLNFLTALATACSWHLVQLTQISVTWMDGRDTHVHGGHIHGSWISWLASQTKVSPVQDFLEGL